MRVATAEVLEQRAGSRQAGAVALRISVLGSMAVEFGSHAVRIPTRKSRAIVAFVALAEGRRETRERLVGLLWSESDEQRARSSLRQALKELRQCFASAQYDGLSCEKLEVELRGAIQVDVAAVLDMAARQQVHPALLDTPHLMDRFLAGLDDIDPAFRGWLVAKRQTLHDRLLRNLEAGLLSDRIGAVEKRRIAAAILNQDATHEEACRTLMRTCATSGDVAAALRAYKALWEVLDEDYGMDPSPETQDLAVAIKQGAYEPYRPAPVPVVRAPWRGLAALAREERGPDEYAPTAGSKIALTIERFDRNGIEDEQAHLVDGFRHHLVSSLVKFREWLVSDKAAGGPGDNGGPRSLAEYHIEGTAYRAGQGISLVLTLREALGGSCVWSDAFELTLADWFASQRRLVQRIAITLNVHISTERLSRFAGASDVSLDVYDRWLRGQAMIARFTPENWARADQLFREAIREAPSFSPAYSSLAQMRNVNHIVHPGVFRDRDHAAETLQLGRTAVRLDPVDCRAQLCLGWAHAMTARFDEAEIHMRLACELNDNDPWTAISTAMFLAFNGDRQRAAEMAQRARELAIAPTFLHWAYQACIRFLGGDYEGCVGAADLAGEAIPAICGWRAAALHWLQRDHEAQPAARRFVNISRSLWCGAAAPSENVVARWLLHLHPIRQIDDWERLRDGLAGAGLIVAGASPASR